MLRRIALSLTVLAGTLLAPQSAQAATVRMNMYNCYFQPWSIVAQPGDTVEVYNYGSTKNLQSYSGQAIGPSIVANGQTFTFEFGGQFTGLRASEGPGGTGQCSSGANDDGCTGMCARVSPTGPALPPTTPVFATPTDGAVLGSNIVTFSGTASNAAHVRVTVQPGNIVVQPPAALDQNGNWSVSRQLGNGNWTASAVAVHSEGYESPASTISFRVEGGDTQPVRILADNPARLAGSQTPIRHERIFVGHGDIQISGIIDDDVEARAVSVTVWNQNIPDTEQPVALFCSNPDAFGAQVPCQATTTVNPKRIRYLGTYDVPSPGHYVVKIEGYDRIQAIPTSYVQEVIILAHV